MKDGGKKPKSRFFLLSACYNEPVSYTHLTPLIANILLIIIAAATLIDIGVTTYRAVKYSESSR